MKNLISVIMPAYNAEPYIYEAVASILRQTYSKLELIVVDDGSSDNTLRILRSINDERLFIHENVKNYGVVYSLNKAVEISNGFYIARMDADDISRPNRLAMQLNFLIENRMDVVSSIASKFNGKSKRNFPCEMTSEEVRYALNYFNPVVHPSVFGYAAVFKKFPYKEEYKWAEDYKLWCELAVAKYKIGIQKDVLLDYRVHLGQVSSKNKITQSELDLRIKKEYSIASEINVINVSIKVRIFCLLKRIHVYLKR